MSLKSTLFITLFLLHFAIQIQAYFMLPVIDPEVEYLVGEQDDINLDNWRNYIPMIKKRNQEGQKLDEHPKPHRKASSVGGHMLKQPNFLKFDFLRRNFLNQKL